MWRCGHMEGISLDYEKYVFTLQEEYNFCQLKWKRSAHWSPLLLYDIVLWCKVQISGCSLYRKYLVLKFKLWLKYLILIFDRITSIIIIRHRMHRANLVMVRQEEIRPFKSFLFWAVCGSVDQNVRFTLVLRWTI